MSSHSSYIRNCSRLQQSLLLACSLVVLALLIYSPNSPFSVGFPIFKNVLRTSQFPKQRRAIEGTWTEGHDNLKEKNYSSDVFPKLHKRVLPAPADEDTWNLAICKGAQLYYRMLGRAPVPETQWNDFDDLIENGWDVGPPQLPFLEEEEALSSLRISTEDADWTRVRISHIRPYKVNNITYPGTGGYYESIFNFEDGVIIAYDSKSPRYMLGRDNQYTKAEIDQRTNGILQQWSDVVFLLWQRFGSMNGHSNPPINFFIRTQINNPTTLSVLHKALENAETSLQSWPGHGWYVKDQDGEALLGTPNGFGQVWFLTQHESMLGFRTINRIKAWGQVGRELDDDNRVYMLFVVGPRPSSEKI